MIRLRVIEARNVHNQIAFHALWLYTCLACVIATRSPVVQRLDSAIHRIKIYPVDNAIDFPNTFFRWIVICLVDSAIQRLNNWGQEIRIARDERRPQSITSIIPSSEIMVKWYYKKRIVMLLPTGRVNYKVAHIY